MLIWKSFAFDNENKQLRPSFYYFESFLLVGPCLIGWIVGILCYPSTDTKFRLAFQSGVIFILYIGLVTLNALLTIFNVFGYLQFSHYVISIIIAFYFSVSIILWISYLKQKSMIFSFFDRILDRLL